jgi:hypothetical protein
MGTGAALYAPASQNLPSTKIATGTSEAFPSADNLSTATARGSGASFFRGAFRSPGVICGRSSWATANDGENTVPNWKQVAKETKRAARYKILGNRGPNTSLAACDPDFS